MVGRALEEEMRRGPVLNCPGAVRDYLRLTLGDAEREVFLCLYLDGRHRLLHSETASIGTLTHAPVYPREIARVALRVNASALIVAHNHPSGDARPSEADVRLTAHLKQILGLLDMRLLDHFVVAGAQVVSFSEKGLL